jgi:chaperonin GroES
MKVLRSNILIEEIGFAPTKADVKGLSSTWGISEKLRGHNPMRIGVVKSIGTDTKTVQEGDIVLYLSHYLMIIPGLPVNQFMIYEGNLMGRYEEIENKNGTLKMDKIKFTPLSDRIIVKKDEPAKPKNGLLVADTTSSTKPLTGTVVRTGDLQLERPLVVKEGDKIMFTRVAGMEIELEEGKFLIMREADVIGIF